MSPRISIITPSYQQAAFLEDTLRSVLGQGYDDLEYLVLDGGSRDGSADILRRHGPRLAYWCSEPDGGQAQAINRGMARATGDILAYLNSDDLYLPGALAHAVERLDPGKAQVLLGNCIQFVEGATQVYGSDIEGDHGRVDLGLRDYVIQPSTFWTRKAWEAAGPFDESLGYTFDWDWFYRASKVADFVLTRRHLSMYRLHASHKSGTGGERRAREVLEVIRRHRGERWGRVAEALAAHHRLFRRVDPLLRRARIPQALVPLARALLPRDLRDVPAEGLRDLIGMVA